MKTMRFTNTGLLNRSLRALFCGGITAAVCLAGSAWAALTPLTVITPTSLSPVPLVCLNPESSGATYASWSGFGTDATIPVITSGTEWVNVSFYVNPVVAPSLNPPFTTTYVILTVGGVAQEYVSLSVSPLIGQDSVNIYAEGSSDSTWTTDLATVMGYTHTTMAIPNLSTQEDVSTALGILNQTDTVDICVDCQAPPSGVPEPTTIIAGALMLLPLGLHGVRILRNRKLVE